MGGRDASRFSVRLVLSVTAIALIFSQVDGASLAARFAAADVPMLGGAFVALMSSALAGGLVWASVFPLGHRLPPLEAVRLSLIGFTVNNVVPTGVGGDVYRAWAVAGRGFGWPLACYSVLMDRWCAFLVLLVGLAGSTAMLLPFLGWGSHGGRTLQGVVLMLGGGFAIATVVMLLWRGRLPAVLGRGGDAAAPFLPEVLDRMRAHVRSPRVVVTLGWAVVSMALEGVSIALTARALGAPAGFLTYAAAAPLFRVMHRVPGFVNAIGPQEMAAMAVWGSLGLGPDTTLPVSLALHGLRLGVGLLGVPLYIMGGALAVESGVRAEGGEGGAD